MVRSQLENTRDDCCFAQARDPTYKSGAWGGARHLIHDDPAFVPFAEMHLFAILQRDAQTPTQQIVDEMHSLDPVLQVVNKTWIYRTLKKHDWTKKNVSFKQQLKFSIENLR